MAILNLGQNLVEYEQTGKGHDIVLLPTLLAEMSVYDEVVDVLAEHNRVTRFNFPGFGCSTGPVSNSVLAYAELIVAAMKAIELPKNTGIIGNGFGGFVAGTLAIHHGDIFEN